MANSDCCVCAHASLTYTCYENSRLIQHAPVMVYLALSGHTINIVVRHFQVTHTHRRFSPMDVPLKLPSLRSAITPAVVNCSAIPWQLMFSMIVTDTLLMTPTPFCETPSWTLIAFASQGLAWFVLPLSFATFCTQATGSRSSLLTEKKSKSVGAKQPV